ncbi:MAG: preprotein translocase subunit Sec61beta [Candidatus Woesearchaeota archaeon]
MSSNRISMPQSGGGLVRYFDEYKSRIEFKPGLVLVFVVIVILIEIVIHTFGKGWFVP